MRALDLGPAWPNAREVVAHTAATAHGFGGFAQCFVNARKAFVVHALNAIAHGLHKAVDQRRLDRGASSAHDAPGANRARVHVRQEQGFVFFALALGFDGSQCMRYAAKEVLDAGLPRFEIFFLQYIKADGLDGRDVLRAAQVFSLHGGVRR